VLITGGHVDTLPSANLSQTQANCGLTVGIPRPHSPTMYSYSSGLPFATPAILFSVSVKSCPRPSLAKPLQFGKGNPDYYAPGSSRETVSFLHILPINRPYGLLLSEVSPSV